MKQLRWKIAQFFENFWWKNYLKNKSPQEYLEWKTAYWNNFLKENNLQKENLQEPMVDIGCGPAGIFCIFKNKNLSALDPLLSNYKDLAIFDKTMYPKTKFIESSFEDAELKEKYNTVFCLNAINHFIDINTSFEKLESICNQKGKLILSIDAHNHSFFRKMFALLPLDILHPHQYNLEEYENLITKNGFEIESKLLLKKEFFFSYWVIVAIKN